MSVDFTTAIQLSHLLSSDIGILGDESAILDTLKNAGMSLTEGNISAAMSEIFHIQMSQEKISTAVNTLLNKHKIYKNGQTLVISPTTLEEISRVSMENERVEKCALDEWVSSYRTQYGNPTREDDIESLKQSILCFVRTFFLKHGADCYKLISGEKQSEYFDVQTVAHSVASTKSGLENCEAFLCTIFASGLTPSQTTFLLTQLKKAVHYLSMVVDSNAQATILQELNGVTIYLDTTILYRLFNLQGDKRHTSTEQFVAFCKKANVRLKVFETTLNELKRRISYDARVIVKYPIPVSFAIIGYNCRTSENYISTFWKEAAATGVSPEDFNYRFSNVNILLERYDISIDDKDYISEYGLEEKVNDLRGKVVLFSSSDPEFEKSTNAIDHDASCLAMISSLQDKFATSVIGSKTFFVSSDWSLIRLQRFDNDYKVKVDMVVLPSQLMQVFCMTAATTDYFEAFLGFFSSSRTYFGTNKLENEQMQKIMGRVGMYRGTTPAYAERVLSNQVIQMQFSEKESDEERIELIDHAMISTVVDMEKELTQKETTVQKVDASLKQEMKENAEKSLTIKDLEERIGRLEDAQTTANNNYENVQNDLLKYKDHFEKKAASYAKRKAVVRVGVGILLFAFGIALIGISVFSLIPPLAKLVAPILLWIATSIISYDLSAIIGYIITLGIAAVSSGVFFLRPGYRELYKKYYNKYLREVDYHK